MLRAFTRGLDGVVRRWDDAAQLRDAWKSGATVGWVDAELPTEEELLAVQQSFRLESEAIEDCLYGEQRPRIDDYDDYLFILIYGAVGTEPDQEFNPRKLGIFCSSRFVITVHAEPLRTLRTMLERCERHAEKTLGSGMDRLLYMIIDMMADNFLHLSETYETRVEELEEEALDLDFEESLLESVSTLRRELLELRRLAVSQRELVTPLARGEYDYISDSLGRQFSHVRDHFTQVVESVESLRERLDGVRDSYHTALAVRTNDIMRILTVFAAVMLPMTLVAGIYGMNLPLWPPPEHPASFWFVVGLMVLLAGGLLLYFRRKKWV